MSVDVTYSYSFDVTGTHTVDHRERSCAREVESDTK